MLEYITIEFFSDNTCNVTIKKENKIIVKKCQYSGKTLVWMFKLGKKWEWTKNLDNGHEIAIFEK